MSVKIGALFDDRYKITARIGHGGMAEVYEATDIISRQTVAIKLIREDIMNDAINLRRFENEATIAAALSHPNIVGVYNHGTYGGRPYIVNEYMKGQTLKEILDFRSTLPLSETLSYLLQLTSALGYAHSHGIVHRDVKPDNIFVLADGTIKLSDFGIAQANGIDDGLTKNQENIIGSVHYLAPEVIQGKNSTAQSDIYAVGITFFEMLTGHVPFDKNSAVNIAVAHIREKFPSPKKYWPGCPKEIERIIFKSTKKQPKDRYSNMNEFYEDLLNAKNNPEITDEKKGFFSRLFGFK